MSKKFEDNPFENIAGEWNQYRKIPISCLNIFLRFIKEDDIILDAGCGNCRNAIKVASKAKNVFAVDSSEQMLKYARENIKKEKVRNIIISNSNILDLPFPDSVFNSVFSLAVLHHLKTRTERSKAFSELSRVLKKNGLLFVSVWNFYQKKFKNCAKEGNIKWKAKNGAVFDRYYYFYEASEIKFLAQNASLKAMEIFYEKEGEITEKFGASNLCGILIKR